MIVFYLRHAQILVIFILYLNLTNLNLMGTAQNIQNSPSTPILYHYNNSHCSKCQEILKTCSPILKSWFEQEQKLDPSVHIMQSYRNETQQNAAFKAGASRVGWGKSAHNYIPCLAIDLCFYIDGKSKQIPSKYKKMLARLPEGIINGSTFPKLIDWCHFEVNNWQQYAKNYPHGNLIS